MRSGRSVNRTSDSRAAATAETTPEMITDWDVTSEVQQESQQVQRSEVVVGMAAAVGVAVVMGVASGGRVVGVVLVKTEFVKGRRWK